MKTLIVCTSVSHGNTRKVAEAMAPALDAEILAPQHVDVDALPSYDLVGFGSGIFNLAFHSDLVRFIASLPEAPRQRSFVFATRGLPEPGFRPYMRTFAAAIERTGFDVVGTFSCVAFDTWPPFAVVGGIRKGRPNAEDLTEARGFAEGIRNMPGTRP